MDAGTRSDIDDVICCKDRILVMLDNNDCISEVAQVLQGLQQPCIVPLVKANRRLVENIKHACQTGSDLGGQANTLAFAARQCAGGPRQGQILKANIIQEFQAFADFLQDPACDFRLLVVQLLRQRIEPVSGCTNGKFSDLANMTIGDLDGERFWFQSKSATGRAGMIGLEAREFFAHPRGFGFPPAALDVADDTFE